MKRTKIIYWTATGLFALAMLGSAIPNVLVSPMAVEAFRQMGLPAFLVPFLGVAKLLGVVAILVPGFPRVREWAYAGLIFDLTGASYIMLALHVPFGDWFFLPIIIILGFLSYAYAYKMQRFRLNLISSAAANLSIAGMA